MSNQDEESVVKPVNKNQVKRRQQKKKTNTAKGQMLQSDVEDDESTTSSSVGTQQNKKNTNTGKLSAIEQGEIKADEAKQEFEKSYINGEKAALVKVDEDGKVNDVDPINLKPDIIGDSLIPKVAENGTVLSMASFTPSVNNINDIRFVRDSALTLNIKYPKIKYKKWNEIPIWIRYETYNKRTIKLIHNPPIKLERSDFSSFDKLFKSVTEKVFQLADLYDVVWLDYEPDDKERNLSIVTNKRAIPNLNLPAEHRYNPISVYQQIEGMSVDYDTIISPYFTNFNPTKDEEANLRRNASFKVDNISLSRFYNFTRPPYINTTNGINVVSYCRSLPPFIIYGPPNEVSLDNFKTLSTDINMFKLPRVEELNSSTAVKSRTYHYDLGISPQTINRVISLIKSYKVLFDFVKPLSKVVRSAFIESIEFSTSTVNKFSEYYSNTTVGMSALRKTAFSTVMSSLSPGVVPPFINAILDLYFNPKAYIVFQTQTNYSVSWTFNAILFLFLFKPQVTSRSAALALVTQIIVNLCKVCSSSFIKTNIPQSLGNLNQYIPPATSALLMSWYNYALSPVNYVADYNALYTNYGFYQTISDRSGNPTAHAYPKGYNLWGAPSFDPWNNYPASESDAPWIGNLLGVFGQFSIVNPSMFDWANVWLSLGYVLVNDQFDTVTTSLFRLINTLKMYASSELFMNRFNPDVRDQMIEIDYRSVLSYGMFAKVTSVPTMQTAIPAFYAYIGSLDYWLSELAMVSTVMKSVDQSLTTFVGLSAQTPRFYKSWDLMKYIGSKSSYEPLGSLFKDVDQYNYKMFNKDLRFKDNRYTLLDQLEITYVNDMDVASNSRWFCHMKALAYLTDTSEWGKFGIANGFKITTAKIKEPLNNEIIRYKIPRVPDSGLVIDYRNSYLRFGDFRFSENLANLLPGRTVSFRMPVFINYKIVDKINDDNEFSVSTGESSVHEWLYKTKDPITTSDFKIHTAEITCEMMPQWEVKYKYNVILFNTMATLVDQNYFVDPVSINDTLTLLTPNTTTDDFYLMPLVDSTVEFLDFMPAEETITGFKYSYRFKAYIVTI